MVVVKLQKRKSGNGEYYSSVITIPNSIIESMSSFKNVKKVDLQIKESFLLIKPVK